jgi:hypothetical protein
MKWVAHLLSWEKTACAICSVNPPFGLPGKQRFMSVLLNCSNGLERCRIRKAVMLSAGSAITAPLTCSGRSERTNSWMQ